METYLVPVVLEHLQSLQQQQRLLLAPVPERYREGVYKVPHQFIKSVGEEYQIMKRERKCQG